MFPARAGMSRAGFPGFMEAADVPRASGDEPAANMGKNVLIECSPRERG